MREPGRLRSEFALFGAIVLLLLSGSRFSEAQSIATQDAQVERGRYLTAAADCTACHTNPKDGRPFAGGRTLETPFGSMLAPNITPDQDTGIGRWTDAQFVDAIRRGRRPDGSRLYPAMPYPYYVRMSEADVLAIRAFLKTMAPVRNAVEPDQLPFPFNIRAAMRLWDELFFDDHSFARDPAKSEAWNRGSYLVNGAGHCAACHTPKNFMGADEPSEFLHGYSLQGWFAHDLTGDAQRGLDKWSTQDLVDYLRNGHNRYAAASGMMAEEVENSSSRMTSSDLQAIAAYLKDLPGHSQASVAVVAVDPRMAAGKSIYDSLCSACHGQDGRGVPYLFPNLADGSSVNSRDATSIVHVLVHGAQSAATDQEPTAPAMPAFGWQLSDAQIAAVATYVRNTWGHSASAVSEGQVAKMRRTAATVP
jgi:mono/diheme cytochrome c family protein